MSSTATFTPLAARAFTISSPIPEQPPVTTATSDGQCHCSLSLRNCQLLRAARFRKALIDRTTPIPNSHLSVVVRVEALTLNGRAWRACSRRNLTTSGARVTAHHRIPVETGPRGDSRVDMMRRMEYFRMKGLRAFCKRSAEPVAMEKVPGRTDTCRRI